jgi:hypothetical protein
MIATITARPLFFDDFFFFSGRSLNSIVNHQNPEGIHIDLSLCAGQTTSFHRISLVETFEQILSLFEVSIPPQSLILFIFFKFELHDSVEVNDSTPRISSSL